MMELKLQTKVNIQENKRLQITPHSRLLLVGSCFAAEIGRRLQEDRFQATVNPYGVMYNPASILHTIEHLSATTDFIPPTHVIITLGTNHVYILKDTEEIVDNCEHRPMTLFREQELSIAECTNYLVKAITTLRELNPSLKAILTVSPIRYQKYGFHKSALSKSTLLLAANEVVTHIEDSFYFPAYEIMNDELRDYRFYKPDMLHPSDQAADYIYESFCHTSLTDLGHAFRKEWQPIRKALNHKPFNPNDKDYIEFREKTLAREKEFTKKWRL